MANYGENGMINKSKNFHVRYLLDLQGNGLPNIPFFPDIFFVLTKAKSRAKSSTIVLLKKLQEKRNVW